MSCLYKNTVCCGIILQIYCVNSIDAGTFTMDQTWCNVPCLFYATFNNKIVVHYNVRLKEIGTSNLFDTMQQCCSATGIECPGKGNVAVLLVSSMSLCVCVCVCARSCIVNYARSSEVR